MRKDRSEPTERTENENENEKQEKEQKEEQVRVGAPLATTGSPGGMIATCDSLLVDSGRSARTGTKLSRTSLH
jgi:hypothetical protein